MSNRRRPALALIALAAVLASVAYLAVTEPSAEGQTQDQTAVPVEQCADDCQPAPVPCDPGCQHPVVCPDGSHATDAPCPDTGLIPPETLPGCPEAPCPGGYPVGDPSEPVPFDDGDMDYPLDVPSGPIEADPGFTG